jgi:hypothetical protein
MANPGGAKPNQHKHGGDRSHAGRKKGVPNKMTQATRDKILASGEITPLIFLLRKMLSPAPEQLPGETSVMYSVRYRLWSEHRLEAAKAAAPYCHPRLASIEQTGKDGGPIQHHLVVEFVE